MLIVNSWLCVKDAKGHFQRISLAPTSLWEQKTNDEVSRGTAIISIS